ncbi:MAG: DUF1573 domain-containing protein [Planctomycetes bacterium]|nr:DUF1573 domain-containing protein [Planctomycetota bacterium]
MRYSLVLLLGLCATSTASASWADGLFGELSKDFGSVPRGPTLTHLFPFTNTTQYPIHIAGVRVSCGCTTANALETALNPGQSTAIYAQMDTRRFLGEKSVTIFVDFDQPQWAEVQLLVHANSREDIMLTPEAFAFGETRPGGAPAAALTVSFLGDRRWQIVGANCDSHYVQTNVKEVRRDEGEVIYQVTAKVRPDTPPGRWYTDVWLATNNTLTPKIRVPLTIDIQSDLSVSPSGINYGEVKVGQETERKIIIRGAKPFKIKGIKGSDRSLKFADNSNESKPVHVLSVTLKPISPGEWNRTLQVITDLDNDNDVEFTAQAQVVP